VNGNRDVTLLNDWFRCNKLSLNVDKTNYSVFSKENCDVNGRNVVTNGSLLSNDADIAAKTGLDVAITSMRFPVSDLLTCVNQLCAKEWQQLWNQCTSNKLHSVQPVVGRSVSSSLGCYDSVLINRLRIGHTRLTNLLKGESQPVCEACHSLLTVKHILVDCTRYSAARQRYFGVATLRDVFENVASRNIIAYVKNIGFYNRI